MRRRKEILKQKSIRGASIDITKWVEMESEETSRIQ